MTKEQLEAGPEHYFFTSGVDDGCDTFYQWRDGAEIEERSPRVEWHVDRLIPARGITFLVGVPGSLKSFVAIAIAAASALGRSWCGRVVDHTPVLYVATEGTEGLGVRLRGYRHDLGLAEPLPAHLRWSSTPVRLANPWAVEALVRDINAVRKAFGGDENMTVLVVIDVLSGCNAGDGDENNSRDMQRLTDALRRLTHANATVIVLHHMDKEGRRYRGHGSLRDCADAMIEAKLKGPYLTLTLDKVRDGARTGEKMLLRPEQVVLPDGESTLVLRLASGELTQTASAAVVPPVKEGRQKLLAALEAFGAAGAKSGEWQHASGLADGTFNRYRRQVTGNEVIKRGNRYVLTRLASSAA